MMTPAGLKIDLVKQNVLSSGELAGLIELRDKTLVQAQDQLDEIASSLSLAMSSNTVAGTQVTAGASNGYQVDIADVDVLPRCHRGQHIGWHHCFFHAQQARFGQIFNRPGTVIIIEASMLCGHRGIK